MAERFILDFVKADRIVNLVKYQLCPIEQYGVDVVKHCIGVFHFKCFPSSPIEIYFEDAQIPFNPLAPTCSQFFDFLIVRTDSHGVQLFEFAPMFIDHNYACGSGPILFLTDEHAANIVILRFASPQTA